MKQLITFVVVMIVVVAYIAGLRSIVRSEGLKKQRSRDSKCVQSCAWTGGTMLGRNGDGCFCEGGGKRWRI